MKASAAPVVLAESQTAVLVPALSPVVLTPPHLGEFLGLRESQNTRANYARDVMQFLLYVGKDPQHVTVEDCVRFFGSLTRLSRSTQNRKRSSVRNYFQHLRDVEFLDHASPMRLMKGLRRSYNPSTRRWLNREEITKLLGAVKDRRTTLGARDYAMVKLLAWTGLRASEICELKIGDHLIEGGRHILHVRGKGGHVRRVTVPDDAWAAIQHYLEKLPASMRTAGNHVFQRTPGRGPRAKDPADKRLTRAMLHKRVQRLARSVGLERVHLHALRHSFAVAARMAGSDLYVISRAMGHSSIATTTMYQHLIEEEKDNAFVAVDRYLSGRTKATRKAARKTAGVEVQS
jgi:integrase/recombinase XerD